MIFYQLTNHCDQKHPYPPPKNLKQNVYWRYISPVFTIKLLLTGLIVLAASLLSIAQTITIKANEKSLLSVMNDIERQSGLDFWYNKGTIKESEKVSLEINNLSLDATLKMLFESKKLSFEIVDKTIFLKPIGEKKLTPKQGDDSQKTEIRGNIKDESGKPVSNATIKIKGTNITVLSNELGAFKIESPTPTGVLIIGSLGYIIREIVFDNDSASAVSVMLKISETNLEEVQVVSTGYQNIPKERGTGSFVLIDSSIISRRVGTNILDRLDGVVGGLVFNKNQGGGNISDITIRGRSTLFANPTPLIILDNFPYEGNINNINPNDIQTITILKDAAAASIWGVKAGNGVIVLTSKKGRSSDKIRVNANINTTIIERPDLHYKQQMSSSEYIDLERFLFDKGYYNSTINNGYRAITPAVDLLLKNRNSQISKEQLEQSLNSLRELDVRNDMEKYLYQKGLSQQYSVSLDGGGNNNNFYISSSYDNNKQNVVANSYERFNINARSNYYLLKNKLNISASILLTSGLTKGSSNSYSNPFAPYFRLADDSGNHLAVITESGLRKQYTDTAGKGALLDWNYRPLDENYSNNETKLIDYKLNGDIKYQILKGFSVGVNYQFQKGNSVDELLNSGTSFFARNLINSYTRLNQTTLATTRPIPLGAINLNRNFGYTSNYGRFLTDFNRNFDKHSVSAIAGFEIKNYQSSSISSTQYGFNPLDASFVPVDFITNFTQYFSTATARIPFGSSADYTIDRFRSSFINFSYSYDQRYILSGSARKDESNIFGVSANKKGVPLWSTGIAWDISKERFYTFPILEMLKLRATFGYSGNVDRTTSAYLTARNGGSSNSWNVGYLDIVNPPNPSLGWEKVKNTNLGIDFRTKANLFSGSIEYYIKQGQDLIANSPIAPQTGIIQYRGNAADTRASGIDITFTKNYGMNANLKWMSTLLFSYNKEEITNYKVKQSSNLNIAQSNFNNPLEGYPYAAIFSFRYSDLDNQGKPIGSLNGQSSQNYSAIINSNNPNELIFNGSAIPMAYGYWRNQFAFRHFELSFNIGFKLNYYFRRAGLFGGSTYSYSSVDFDKRWQKPGDELLTNIPALVYPANSAQNSFFQYSEASVEKGDHVRLQDIKLTYQFKSIKGNRPLNNLQIYSYAQNLGILWKATKTSLDPDIGSGQFLTPLSFSIGLSTNF